MSQCEENGAMAGGTMGTQAKVVLAGGAGLVGQNLVVRLKDRGYTDIVVLDKHRRNLKILAGWAPDVVAEYADLSQPGQWQEEVARADVVVMLQAQIGGNDYQEFRRNNVESTRLVLDAMKTSKAPYLVHISSSVVESVANDFYTNTKGEQEELVRASGIPSVVLRPTLMFGWFDRKHLGWLSRFMQKVPLFPIPGNGKYMRQPLFVQDFCSIILDCIERRPVGDVYNISGLDRVDYIDIIREIRSAIHSRTAIVCIPYTLFHALLWTWALFDKAPPFTTQQLKALVAHDEFEVIDWPEIFNVQPTPFNRAIQETFRDARYADVILEF